ncbi:MAG: RagB/SusD family nutrient uptake outer membrane protein [Bacteroidales bacterium]|nr:RagB/SusD family nutrient uptake outer membrane protein [Bacteroidales bacterium]
MKRIKIYVLILAAFCMASCNEWLDVEPSTEMDRNALFSNEVGFTDAMSGIYTVMTEDALYGRILTWHLMEIMGGGAYCSSGYNQYYSNYYFHPAAPNYLKSYQTSVIDPIWRRAYNAIANINSVLECIDEKQEVFEGNDCEVFKGEALGLRAFLHFDILRLYGDAPGSEDYSDTKIYIPYVNGLSSNVYPLLTVKMATDAMLKDLNEAKELLKNDPMYLKSAPSQFVCNPVTGLSANREKYNIKEWHNRRLHFNYYAAVATMARIYMWLGDQEHALACAKEIIDAQETTFPWVNPELIANTSSTSNSVSRDRVFSTEHIFALNVVNIEDKMDGILHETQTSFNNSSMVLGINTDYCFDAATRDSDPRYTYLKYIHSAEYQISTKYWKDPDLNNQYSPWSVCRLPLIKVSEMYYIAAECEPDLVAATAYLEAVRSHRGLSPYPVSVTNKIELQEEIEKEYRKEFISEGQLFYYKKRMNQDIVTKTKNASYTITPACFTMPRPDDEDTYGGRN